MAPTAKLLTNGGFRTKIACSMERYLPFPEGVPMWPCALAFLRDEGNRALLGWIGGAVAAVAGGLWAVIIFNADHSKPSPPVSQSLEAGNGNVIASGPRATFNPPIDTANPEAAAATGERQRQEAAAKAEVERSISRSISVQPRIVDREGRTTAQPRESTFSRSPNELLGMVALGNKLKELPKGDIVLDAPKAMKVGEERQVDANVGINVPMEILQKTHVGDLPLKGQAHLSSEMIATLTGPGFKIEPITPERQAIANGFPTVWSWNIEAKEAGDEELEATLYALVPNGDGKSRQRVNSYTQTISVSVRELTWRERLDAVSHDVDTVKNIVAGLGISATTVMGWGIWRWWQKKKRESATSVRKLKGTFGSKPRRR